MKKKWALTFTSVNKYFLCLLKPKKPKNIKKKKKILI